MTRSAILLDELAFAVLLSSGMLLPNSGIPGLLWVAHFAEVFTSSVVLGLVVVPLVHHAHHPFRWIGARLRRRRGMERSAGT